MFPSIYFINSENFLRLQIFYEDLSASKTISEESYKVDYKCIKSKLFFKSAQSKLNSCKRIRNLLWVYKDWRITL